MAEYLSPAVYIEELSSGNKPIEAAGTSTGAFVGLAEKGPVGQAIPIQNFAEFTRTFGGYIDQGHLAFAVKAFFDEGGTSCFVVRTCHYSGVPPALTATATPTFRIFMTTGNPGAENSIRISAASPGAWGDQLAVQITFPDAATFDLAVRYNGTPVERFQRLSMDRLDPAYVVSVIQAQAKWITVADIVPAASVQSMPQRRPQVTTGFTLLRASGTAGNDGLANLTAADFTGDETAGNGLRAFDRVESIRIVSMPDAFPEAHVQGMAYCESRGDCFYIADLPANANTIDDVLNYKLAQGVFAGSNALNSKYGALYTPWIQVFDPRSGGRVLIPPSGAVAGRYAATDASRGVHKAAAGTEDGLLRSALGLEFEYTATDQERLNPKGIDVIRSLPGVGRVIWGARTTSSDPEWRYLNVRRLFLFLETSIRQSTNWIVFEPNDRALWKSITRNISAFLKIQWLQGALVGTKAEEAFFVKCDEETNPQESIDLGRVITEIGVAPSKPAEFVIFRISQQAGGAPAS